MILRCTARAAGLLAGPRADLARPAESDDDWYANVLWIERLDRRKPNVVLSVRGANVFVGTEVSPDGAPVASRKLQEGLDRLYAEGALRITPETFGWYRRSCFIGALLATIPEIEIERRPLWIRLPAARQARSWSIPHGPAAIRSGDLPRDRSRRRPDRPTNSSS